MNYSFKLNIKIISIFSLIILLTVCTYAEGKNIDKDTGIFEYKYNPEYTHMKAIEYDKPYCGVPSAMPNTIYNTDYIQPWSAYTPPYTKPNKKYEKNFPCQTANIKTDYKYTGIEVGHNKWTKMACEEALISAQHKGGPFGAVIVQIDDSTGEVIRYWRNHNHVTEWNDPTAHAEVSTIRAACKELGVIDLGTIRKNKSKLPQVGETSHCEIYVNAEPCPMCYAAISWANIPVVVFCATKYDAAVQGVNFSDEKLYHEMELPYKDRTDREIFQSTTNTSLDAFNFWKRSSSSTHY